MRSGTGTFSAIKQNIKATAADLGTKRWMVRQPQLCWKCQKDKPITGGTFKLFGGGVRRFICGDCIAEKQAALAKANGAPE